MWKCSIEFKYNSWRSWIRGSKTNPNFQLVNKNLLDQSTQAILLQNSYGESWDSLLRKIMSPSPELLSPSLKTSIVKHDKD